MYQLGAWGQMLKVYAESLRYPTLRYKKSMLVNRRVIFVGSLKWTCDISCDVVDYRLKPNTPSSQPQWQPTSPSCLYTLALWPISGLPHNHDNEDRNDKDDKDEVAG